MLGGKYTMEGRVITAKMIAEVRDEVKQGHPDEEEKIPGGL